MTKIDWIRDKLVSNNLDKQKLYDLYERFNDETNSIWSLDSYKRCIRKVYDSLNSFDDDQNINNDLDKESLLRLSSQKQKLLDTNNVIRKENRETYRLYNYLESLYSEYVSIMKDVVLPEIKIKEHKGIEEKIGIIQLSDLHMNSFIIEEDSFGNSFDFNIASKRLKKFISESCKIFDIYSVNTVYILITGDLISSSRLITQKLSQITSLSKASLLTTFIIQQIILELAKKYEVYFTGVVGNESRIPEDMDSSSILNSENFDYLIYNNLQLIFNDKTKNIHFIKPSNNIQNVVTLKNGFNALLLHGHTFKSSSTVEKNVASVLSNYVYKGIPIHGIFYGHYHSASISDIVSRSGSLCGANSYSAYDLMYLSRASQNCYIVDKDLSYNAIKIDLQNVDNIEGYQIVEALESYDIDASKIKPNMEVISRNLV